MIEFKPWWQSWFPTQDQWGLGVQVGEDHGGRDVEPSDRRRLPRGALGLGQERVGRGKGQALGPFWLDAHWSPVQATGDVHNSREWGAGEGAPGMRWGSAWDGWGTLAWFCALPRGGICPLPTYGHPVGSPRNPVRPTGRVGTSDMVSGIVKTTRASGGASSSPWSLISCTPNSGGRPWHPICVTCTRTLDALATGARRSLRPRLAR